MMPVGQKSRVWLAQHKVDFRKQHQGLLAECYKMALDPFQGDVVIFVGKNRRRIKVIYADSTGYWVSSKVFTMEAMKTRFSFLSEPSCKSVTSADLAMLMEGARYTVEKKVRSYAKTIENNNNLQEIRSSTSVMSHDRTTSDFEKRI